MRRSRPHSASGAAPAPARGPGWLAVLAVFAAFTVMLLGSAQGPGAEPEKETAPVTEAVALDKKLMAEAKSGSEIMANLTYLSDIIGPRLTGSAALKRANEWAAEKMKS